MTLDELVDLVCTKCHRNDPPTIAEARKFVRARYRIIYESRVWRDAIDPPMVLRGSALTNEFGDPLTDENGNILTTGIAGQMHVFPFIVGTVISCRWGNTTVLQTEEMANMIRLNPGVFETIGDPISFSITSPSAVTMSPGGYKIRIKSTDNNARYQVSVRGSNQERDVTELMTASGTSWVDSKYEYDQISSLGKDSTAYDLVVQDALGGSLLSLPAQESSRLHQRIHFHSTPRQAGNLLVLYKRRCRDLINGSDATEIAGIDNAVLAAAISDMREGERQYGKAALKAQEVAGLMANAMGLEKEQSANACRIIPEDIHGIDWSGKEDW